MLVAEVATAPPRASCREDAYATGVTRETGSFVPLSTRANKAVRQTATSLHRAGNSLT